MNHNLDEMRKDILACGLDDVTRVHMIKVLEDRPSGSDLHVLCKLLEMDRRHKLHKIKVDTLMARNSNQP